MSELVARNRSLVFFGRDCKRGYTSHKQMRNTSELGVIVPIARPNMGTLREKVNGYSRRDQRSAQLCRKGEKSLLSDWMDSRKARFQLEHFRLACEQFASLANDHKHMASATAVTAITDE